MYFGGFLILKVINIDKKIVEINTITNTISKIISISFIVHRNSLFYLFYYFYLEYLSVSYM